MKITLITDMKRSCNTIDVQEGIKAEGLAKSLYEEGKVPYRILLARINGADRELDEVIEEGDTVELLDMRTHCANMAYQRGLTLLYLTAAQAVFEEEGLGDVRIEIDNSLNKGFFTLCKRGDIVKLPQDIIDKIYEEMKRIVSEDRKIEKKHLTEDEAVAYWKERGYGEKAELMANCREGNIPLYSMGGEWNHFYGPLVPSAGYLEHFELRAYEDGILLRFPYYNRPDMIPSYRDERKIFEAFEEENKWLNLLGTAYLADLNEAVKEGKTKEMILLSEALHEKRIAWIAETIKREGKRIILIAGPSSSGKTTFARRLCIQLRVAGLRPVYMGTDDYFLNRDQTPLDENGEKDFENIGALDIDLFTEDIKGLLAGESVDIPEFDFMEGVKVFGRRITKIDKDQPIVIEGIHALNRLLTEGLEEDDKFRIYISPFTQLNIDMHNRVPTTDARMLRRMVRDYRYRGHSAAGTIASWPKVRAGEDRNIFPYSVEADVIFNSTLAYETCVLKKYAEPLLREIGEEESEYSEAIRLLEFIKYFEIIDDDSDIPNNSILREFIGGSVFVE